jgi:DNA-binding response OmpR family regulator
VKKILIIEDDSAIAAIERDYLEIEGFQVEIAADGTKGLGKALNGGFDLILLDLMLPGIDGFTVCRRLREALDIPILMITARREDIDKIRGLGLGADDYIEKPFSPSVLVARVKAHLAQYERLKQSENPKPEIMMGAIRVNTDTHRVYVDEEEKELKNKEYELLLFLMINVDVVFNREALYEKIWGMDARQCDEAVHINRLREKIEEDRPIRLYQTVWARIPFKAISTAASKRYPSLTLKKNSLTLCPTGFIP